MRVHLRNRVQHDFTQQKGGASLLTTMVLAIALIGIISGLTALSVRELRQASNNEQSKRALAGAESYASKLATQLDDNPALVVNDCKGKDTPPATRIPLGNNLDATCVVVSNEDSTETTGVVPRDESFRIDLSKAHDSSGAVRPVTGMSVEWDKGDATVRTGSAIAGAYPASSWPSRAAGNVSVPGAPELTYVWWNSLDPASWDGLRPGGSKPEDSGLPITKVLLKPARSTSGGPTTACGTGQEYTCNSLSLGASIPSSAGKGFTLAAVDGSPGGTNLVFKLTARYNAMHFRLKFYNGNTLLSVPQPYATIDVTARSGNLYRRVIAQKPLEQSGAYNFLDNVVFSGRNICKDMQVGADHKPVNGGTGKNTLECEN